MRTRAKNAKSSVGIVKEMMLIEAIQEGEARQQLFGKYDRQAYLRVVEHARIFLASQRKLTIKTLFICWISHLFVGVLVLFLSEKIFNLLFTFFPLLVHCPPHVFFFQSQQVVFFCLHFS